MVVHLIDSCQLQGLADLHATLTRLLGEQHTVFEESWQRLTLPQRAVLRALVLQDGRELLSVRQDIVMKEGSRYVASDSLYREWVARQTF